jgi:hypothetical protein
MGNDSFHSGQNHLSFRLVSKSIKIKKNVKNYNFEELLALFPTINLEERPLPAVRGHLFSTFTMVAVSSTRNQRTPYIFLLREALHMDQ